MGIQKDQSNEEIKLQAIKALTNSIQFMSYHLEQ